MSARPNRKEFRRVRAEGKPEKVESPENEIRVTAKGSQRMYISYAIAIMTGTDGKTKHDTIKVSAMGAAIYNVVNIAEIVKRRVKGVHQTTEISSQTLQDTYEAIDKEKEGMTVERKVSSILITLSTNPLDKSHIGYQAPLPEDQVTEQEERKAGESTHDEEGAERRRGGGRPRSARGGRGAARGGRGGSDEKPARGGRGPAADSKPARGGRRGDDEKPARGGRGAARGGRGGSDDKPARGGRGAARGGRGGSDEKPARGGRGGRSDDRPARGGRSDDKPARGGRSERGRGPAKE